MYCIIYIIFISFFILAYTELSNSRLSQRQSVFYSGSKHLLLHNLRQLSDEIDIEDAPTLDNDGDEEKYRAALTRTLKMFKVLLKCLRIKHIWK